MYNHIAPCFPFPAESWPLFSKMLAFCCFGGHKKARAKRTFLYLFNVGAGWSVHSTFQHSTGLERWDGFSFDFDRLARTWVAAHAS